MLVAHFLLSVPLTLTLIALCSTPIASERVVQSAFDAELLFGGAQPPAS
jgi:hypothetical protein